MKEMILRHYSAKMFPLIDMTRELKISDKPRGLWLSDDSDEESCWPAWCRAETFQLENLRFQYRARLHAKAAVLILASAFEIDAFTTEYGRRPAWQRDRGYYRPEIDWPEVGQKYQGIIITPYQWTRRLEGGSPWYYGWDCASGCIWDISALEIFEFEAEFPLSIAQEGNAS